MALDNSDAPGPELYELLIGRTGYGLRQSARHERQVAGNECVFINILQPLQKHLRRVIGPKAFNGAYNAAGLKHRPKQFRRLPCPSLAAVTYPGHGNVMSYEPSHQPLDIGLPLVTQRSLRVHVLRQGVAVLDEIQSHIGFCD